jgi:hypothetical protein
MCSITGVVPNSLIKFILVSEKFLKVNLPFIYTGIHQKQV